MGDCPNSGQLGLLEMLLLRGLLINFKSILPWAFRQNLRSRLSYRFQSYREFFAKRIPSAEHYPFEVEDPVAVFGDRNAYRHFTLVGKNWHETDPSAQKPIAVLFGFNDWKYGFAADYLPEYRCAFARRKFRGLAALMAMFFLRPKPQAFIAWGMNEPWIVRRYGASRRIPLIRMEDGFLRSLSLGSSHSTPYSLALDNEGIYYDPSKPSRLESILEKHDFTNDTELLDAADVLIGVMAEHGLSKYNQTSGRSSNVSAHPHAKRVLVIGQVHGDASLRLGNPDGWSMEEMLLLARHENPGAEILYRPHPDVYAGFQLSPLKLRRIEKFATIVPPDTPLQQSLDAARCVYTITSLVGIEAVIRGIPTVVLGAPFYAGWGLTDDRCSQQPVFSRRTRKLTLSQLVAGTYLIYPRYLANLEHPVKGAATTCYRLAGEVEASLNGFSDLSHLDDKETLRRAAGSYYWPMIFSSLSGELTPKQALTIARGIDLDALLQDPDATTYHMIALCYLAGQLRHLDAVNLIINRARERIAPEVLYAFVHALWDNCQNPILMRQFAWLLDSIGQNPEALDILRNAAQEPPPIDDTDNELEEPPSEYDGSTLVSFSDKIAGSTLALAQMSIKSFKPKEALSACHKLLLANSGVNEAFTIAIEASRSMFDIQSAANIALLGSRFAHPMTRAQMHLAVVRELRHLQPFDSRQFVRSAFAASHLSPESAATTLMICEMFLDRFKWNDFHDYFIGAMKCNNELSYEKARGFIALEEPDAAVDILLKLLKQNGDDYRVLAMLSQAYSYQQDFVRARQTINYAMSRFKNAYTYKEALRLAGQVNDGTWGREIVKAVEKQTIDLGEMLLRKMHYLNREVREAHLMFRTIKMREIFQYFYPEKFVAGENFDQHDFSRQNVLLIANFGPGDEIRYAQMYSDLARDSDFGAVEITCDPRLEALMRRSFPDLKFVPVFRVREYGFHFDLAPYRELPGYELHIFLDNNGHQRLMKADKGIFLTDLLAKYRSDYPHFSGHAYLLADTERSRRFRNRLPRNGKIFVGLSWRSSVTTFSRNEHYLTIEEIAPIFALEGIQFVNLQYDDCADELAWADKHFPGRLLHIDDLDQFNDLDGVAALMKTLDLVVSPATTVVELAGALGCPTLLIASSSEMRWRKKEGSVGDVWHDSLEHVDVDAVGDKEALVLALLERLRGIADRTPTRLVS